MALYIGLVTDSSDAIADDIASRLRAMHGAITSWRADINTTSATDSWRAAEMYQMIVSNRNFVEAKKGTAGLAAAYVRQNPALNGTYNVATEWAAAKTAIDAFVTWFQTNWPKKAPTGEPAYLVFNGNGEHKSFSFALTGTPKTTVLARLDAILAAFV